LTPGKIAVQVFTKGVVEQLDDELLSFRIGPRERGRMVASNRSGSNASQA